MIYIINFVDVREILFKNNLQEMQEYPNIKDMFGLGEFYISSKGHKKAIEKKKFAVEVKIITP